MDKPLDCNWKKGKTEFIWTVFFFQLQLSIYFDSIVLTIF